MPIIQIDAFQCNKCGYIWLPNKNYNLKDNPPVHCANPKCRSAYWNRKQNTPFTMAKGKVLDRNKKK